MSLPAKINKENFRLLDLSSDEESDDLQLEIIPSRKKKVTRRDRNRNPTPRALEPNIGHELQCALKWAVRGTLLLWLLMLTLLCATLYDQVTSMKIAVDQVSTSSNGVSSALQVCHTAAKELRANTTALSGRLMKLELEHHELAKEVEQAMKNLAAVSGQLAAAPELKDMPTKLDGLKTTVAELGSQIKSFDAALATARKQAGTVAAGVEEVKTMVHQLDARTNETIANVTANTKREDEFKQQIAALNTTVEAKMESLRTRIEDLNKTTSTVAPTSPSTVASSTAAAVTTPSTTTTTLTPGPPAKPYVLH